MFEGIPLLGSEQRPHTRGLTPLTLFWNVDKENTRFMGLA
jgi:hypothetical protein